jgi:hypothetical protein
MRRFGTHDFVAKSKPLLIGWFFVKNVKVYNKVLLYQNFVIYLLHQTIKNRNYDKRNIRFNKKTNWFRFAIM